MILRKDFEPEGDLTKINPSSLKRALDKYGLYHVSCIRCKSQNCTHKSIGAIVAHWYYCTDCELLQVDLGDSSMILCTNCGKKKSIGPIPFKTMVVLFYCNNCRLSFWRFNPELTNRQAKEHYYNYFENIDQNDSTQNYARVISPGLRCPHCNGENLTGGELVDMGNEIYARRYRCIDCGHVANIGDADTTGLTKLKAKFEENAGIVEKARELFGDKPTSQTGFSGMMYSIEDCAMCHGKGLYVGGCLACGGNGSVAVPKPPKKCAMCGGSGFRVGVCRVCHGRGWAGAKRIE